jgi:ABC-type sugar transport system substrate-binding protein
MIKSRYLNKTPTIACLAVLSGMMAACASSASPTSSAAPSGTATCVNDAKAALAPYSGPMHALRPISSVNVVKLRGKTVWTVALATSAPLAIESGVVAAGHAAGVNVHAVSTTPSISNAVAAVNDAIAEHAEGIVLSAGTVTSLAQPIANATTAHIPFVDVFATPNPNDALVSGEYSHVTSSFTLSGKLEADGILAATQCKADVVMGELPGIPTQEAVSNGNMAEFKRLCATCAIHVLDIPLTDTPVQVQGLVKTELLRYPNANFFDMNNDNLALDAYQTLKAAKMREAGVNCDPSILKMLAAHDTLVIDVCPAPLQYQGWVGFDELARAIDGKPAQNVSLPVRYVGPNTTIDPGELTPGFGNYEALFEQAWGIRK